MRHQEGPHVKMTARDKLEAYLITVRPRTPGPMAEQPSCPPPRRPCPVTSLALSVCVSPWTIHFLVLDKNPLLGPGRGPPSCNSFSDCFWNTYESTGRVISPISSPQDWYLPHKNPACCPPLWAKWPLTMEYFSILSCRWPWRLHNSDFLQLNSK